MVQGPERETDLKHRESLEVMTRLGGSVDIGEELGVGSEDAGLKVRDADASMPNVVLGWEKKGLAGSASHAEHSTHETADASHAETKKGHATGNRIFVPVVWGILALLFIAVLSGYSFSQTASFPGIDKAVEFQILEGLRKEVSGRISQDYRTVSDIRRRYMFQERFDALRKTPETRALIVSKQEQAKDLFRDENGRPYLYAAQAYRYAAAAGRELHLKKEVRDSASPPSRQRGTDARMGKAIANFHRLTAVLGVNEGLEWSAMYVPVAVGLVVVVLVSVSAWVLSSDPLSSLIAGIIAGLHPVVMGQFSAGLPHPLLLSLIPVWMVIVAVCVLFRIRAMVGKVLAGVGGIAVLALLERGQTVPLLYVLVVGAGAGGGVRWFLRGSWVKGGAAFLAAGCSLAGLVAWAPVSWSDLVTAGRVLGGGMLVLSAASAVFALVLIMQKRAQGSLYAVCGAWIAALVMAARDPSTTFLPLTSGLLVGVAAGAARPLGEKLCRSLGVVRHSALHSGAVVTVMALVVFVVVQGGSTSAAIVLPAIDDALVDASAALARASFPGDVFIGDSVTSDPVMFFSNVEPVVHNDSDLRVIGLFARALMAGDDAQAMGLLQVLACPQQLEAVLNHSNITEDVIEEERRVSRVCPRQAFVVVSEETWRQIPVLAQQAGVDLAGQRASGVSSCSVKPEGGIVCQNGFELVGLNATKNGRFPAQMVSFVGKKRVVSYPDPDLEGAFIIFRDGDALFSAVVPPAISSSLLVRAMARDESLVLEKVFSRNEPTQVVVFKLKSPG